MADVTTQDNNNDNNNNKLTIAKGRIEQLMQDVESSNTNFKGWAQRVKDKHADWKAKQQTLADTLKKIAELEKKEKTLEDDSKFIEEVTKLLKEINSDTGPVLQPYIEMATAGWFKEHGKGFKSPRAFVFKQLTDAAIKANYYFHVLKHLFELYLEYSYAEKHYKTLPQETVRSFLESGVDKDETLRKSILENIPAGDGRDKKLLPLYDLIVSQAENNMSGDVLNGKIKEILNVNRFGSNHLKKQCWPEAVRRVEEARRPHRARRLFFDYFEKVCLVNNKGKSIPQTLVDDVSAYLAPERVGRTKTYEEVKQQLELHLLDDKGREKLLALLSDIEINRINVPQYEKIADESERQQQLSKLSSVFEKSIVDVTNDFFNTFGIRGNTFKKYWESTKYNVFGGAKSKVQLALLLSEYYLERDLAVDKTGIWEDSRLPTEEELAPKLATVKSECDTHPVEQKNLVADLITHFNQLLGSADAAERQSDNDYNSNLKVLLARLHAVKPIDRQAQLIKRVFLEFAHRHQADKTDCSSPVLYRIAFELLELPTDAATAIKLDERRCLVPSGGHSWIREIPEIVQAYINKAVGSDKDHQQLYSDLLKTGVSSVTGKSEWALVNLFGKTPFKNMKELKGLLQTVKAMPCRTRNEANNILKKLGYYRSAASPSNTSLETLLKKEVNQATEIASVKADLKTKRKLRDELQDKDGNKGEVTLAKEAYEKLSKADPRTTLYNALRQQIDTACTNYVNKVGMKFMERRFHRKTKYASALHGKVRNANSLTEALLAVKDFLSNANVRYRDHSFTYYLLEELLRPKVGILGTCFFDPQGNFKAPAGWTGVQRKLSTAEKESSDVATVYHSVTSLGLFRLRNNDKSMSDSEVRDNLRNQMRSRVDELGSASYQLDTAIPTASPAA